MADPELFEHTNAESPIFHSYRTLIANLDQQPVIAACQVRSLLELKARLLKFDPTHTMNDRSFFRVALDRWNHGNRLSALEYVFREAFEENIQNYDGYKSRATFWSKCAEGLLEEPLCMTDHMYQLMREEVTKREDKDGDPELFDALDAALQWNHARHDPNANVYRISSLFDQYEAARDELFGLD